ncbi:hypothetical protein AB5I39_04155 [Sphingomonas sp. MMS24-J45]|uniref:hypothetical protein n=1 Tax=Sphingomonas sp. MMS24-J45 TaxID=3238806 RepID=UPI00384BC6CB
MLPLPHSTLRAEPELMLALTQARITWVLDHPHTSGWVKDALRGAEGIDPVTLQNDVEMIRHLLLPRCQAQIDLAMGKVLVE